MSASNFSRRWSVAADVGGGRITWRPRRLIRTSRRWRARTGSSRAFCSAGGGWQKKLRRGSLSPTTFPRERAAAGQYRIDGLDIRSAIAPLKRAVWRRVCRHILEMIGVRCKNVSLRFDILKGAMLFVTWVADPFRPTRDLDLLGLGNSDVEAITGTFRAICAEQVADDGVLHRNGCDCGGDHRLVLGHGRTAGTNN